MRCPVYFAPVVENSFGLGPTYFLGVWFLCGVDFVSGHMMLPLVSAWNLVRGFHMFSFLSCFSDEPHSCFWSFSAR